MGKWRVRGEKNGLGRFACGIIQIERRPIQQAVGICCSRDHKWTGIPGNAKTCR